MNVDNRILRLQYSNEFGNGDLRGIDFNYQENHKPKTNVTKVVISMNFIAIRLKYLIVKYKPLPT